MKKIFYFVMVAVLTYGCSNEDEWNKPCSIYGTVISSQTGEPIQNAEIQIRGGSKVGWFYHDLLGTTVTGSDGYYEFNDITSSYGGDSTGKDYTIVIGQSAFEVHVGGGQRVKRDILF